MIPPRMPGDDDRGEGEEERPRDGSIGGAASSPRFVVIRGVQDRRPSADGIAMQELATTWPVGSPAMRVLVMLPTYNEIENIDDVLERARRRAARRRHPRHRRRQPRRHRRPGREARRRARRHRRAAPGGEVGPRLRVPRRVPRRARRRLRRHDRDGRRPLARPRGAARPRRRGRAGRRPRHRLALRAGRLDPRLEVAAGARSRAAAASTRAPCSGCSVHDATAGFRAYHRRQPLARSTSTTCGPTATASRWR